MEHVQRQILTPWVQVGPKILHFSQTSRQCQATDPGLHFVWVTVMAAEPTISAPFRTPFPHLLLSLESFASPTT